VATPKDKPLAEATVRFVEDHIVKKLRHSQCFSVAEYNQLAWQELNKLNNRPFEKKEGTRNSCFDKYEKAELKPLPSVPYQFFQKQAAIVQKNCCIAYGKNYYSVPYKKVKVGMELSLHIYSDTIEIWNKRSTEKLCEHELVSKGHSYVYVIKSEHMPPKSYRFGDWSSDRFKREAREIGMQGFSEGNAGL
jgi:hypothetical protein